MVSGLVLAVFVLSPILLSAVAKPVVEKRLDTSDVEWDDLVGFESLSSWGDDDEMGDDDKSGLHQSVVAHVEPDITAMEDESISCVVGIWPTSNGYNNQPYGAYELHNECLQLNKSVGQLEKCPDGWYKGYALNNTKDDMAALECSLVFQWLHAHALVLSNAATTTTTVVPIQSPREGAGAKPWKDMIPAQRDASRECISKVNMVMYGEVDALRYSDSSPELTREVCELIQRGVRLLSQCPTGAEKSRLLAQASNLEDDLECPVWVSGPTATGGTAGEGDKNDRDDLDDEEVERQRIHMDKLFEEIYGTDGGSVGAVLNDDENKSQLEMLDDGDESSELGKSDKDADCVTQLDAKLFGLIDSNGSALCETIEHGIVEVGQCPDGSVKSDYTSTLKHMHSQLCDDGGEEGEKPKTGAVVKVPLKKKCSKCSAITEQPMQAVKPALSDNDGDEEVGKDEGQDASACLMKLSDEFEAKLKGADLCKVVKQALGELDRCGDSKMKRESRDNLLAVDEFCSTSRL